MEKEDKMNKSLKHRILVMVVLGLVAAVISAGVVYASMVQWSEEVPATVEHVPASALPEDAVLLFADEGLTKPLTELKFTIPKWLPPLSKVFPGGVDPVPVWIKNNSDHTLMVVQPSHPVQAIVDGKERWVGHVILDIPWWREGGWEEQRIFGPGQVIPGWVSLHLNPDAPDTFGFKVVFGAVGGEEMGVLPRMMPMVEPPPEGRDR